MFTTLLLFVYCFPLVVTLSIDSKYVDGNQYTIKSVNTTYTQRVSNHGQCTVELNEQYQAMTEGEIIKIKDKWFKVENCRLNRAYIVSCGSKLFRQMGDLVCSYVEQHYKEKNLKRRQTEDELIHVIDRSYYGVCCQSACTISELVHSCPSKW